MKHASGQFLHEGRWCSEKELERLRREAEDDPEAQEHLRRTEMRCGMAPGPERKKYTYPETEHAGAWSPRGTESTAVRRRPTSGWTEYDSEETYREAIKYANGAYQLAVLDGIHNLSTSSLQGPSPTSPRANWDPYHFMPSGGEKRKISIDNLLKRLMQAGFIVQERRAKSGGKPRRILVISRPRRSR